MRLAGRFTTTMFWLLTRKPNNRPKRSLVIDRTTSESASLSCTVLITSALTRIRTVATPSSHWRPGETARSIA
jgi:hypothetical protein